MGVRRRDGEGRERKGLGRFSVVESVESDVFRVLEKVVRGGIQ